MNYVRNSVKVVVDAYDGTTTFYQVDDEDPIIRTYAKIFPKMFTPIDEMPAGLQAHLRYPEDMFLTQVNKYRTYHITDPGGLYNREDIWNIPTEVFDGQNVPVEPYYVIMRLPGESQEEFVLIMPLTPARRENTIAWVAARSDPANYGELVSFRFPTNSLVFGPRQVESRIDQDPTISAQFSLWNQGGSNVIRGNLLMIPIGNGNLFVEPIYLQAAEQPATGAEASRRGQRQPYRHGADARPRPRGGVRPGAAHRPRRRWPFDTSAGPADPDTHSRACCSHGNAGAPATGRKRGRAIARGQRRVPAGAGSVATRRLRGLRRRNRASRAANSAARPGDGRAVT